MREELLKHVFKKSVVHFLTLITFSQNISVLKYLISEQTSAPHKRNIPCIKLCCYSKHGADTYQ